MTAPTPLQVRHLINRANTLRRKTRDLNAAMIDVFGVYQGTDYDPAQSVARLLDLLQRANRDALAAAARPTSGLTPAQRSIVAALRIAPIGTYGPFPAGTATSAAGLGVQMTALRRKGYGIECRGWTYGGKSSKRGAFHLISEPKP